MEIMSFSFTDDIPDGLIMRECGNGKLKEKIISIDDFIRSFINSSKADLSVNYWMPKNCLKLSCVGDELHVVVTSDIKTSPATFYERSTREEFGYILPYPKLLFYFRYNVRSSLLMQTKVFAIKRDDNSINPDLYVFPYSNVYDGGSVCFGSNVFELKNERLDLSVQEAIEMFYATPYNGDLYNMAATAFLCKSTKSLFKKLDGKKIFPEDKLVPLNQQLTDII